MPIDKNQLQNWGLNEKILNYYGRKGISRFFDWQVECLELPGVLMDQKNLVYSAPTSAERRKKAIIILPFVSITVEKVQNLKQVFRRLGLRIDSFAGQTNPRGGLQRVDAAVCTIEKANNMINRLIEERKIADIGLIIVDELHMIGDTSRGYILELLLSKLMHMKSNPLAEDLDISQLQIVGMSATIPNLKDIAKWLDAELFITDYRPVPLDEHVVVGNEILKVSTNSTQPNTQFNSCESVLSLRNNGNEEIECTPMKTIDCNQLKLNTTMFYPLIYMAIETLAQGFSTLIFCPTRSLCESMAKNIASNIFSIGQKERVPQNDFERYLRERIHSDQILSYQKLVSIIKTLKRSSSGFDTNLERVMRFGCAFHHAGMTMEERGTVEQGFRDGTLRILCCTTTLSAGVNLPARRVMITSPLDYANNLLAVGNYRQMIGRAGRKGIDTLGESFLFCTDKDVRMARRLITAEMRPIKSNLLTIQKSKNNTAASSNTKWQPVINDQLLRAVLEVIANEMVKNIDDIVVYLGCTFFQNCPLNLMMGSQQQETQADINEEIINECLRLVLDKLKTYEFIFIQSSSEENNNNNETIMGNSRIVVTDLGRAVISSGVSPTDGQFIYEELKRFRTKATLLNDLHLTYQTTPVYVVNQLPDIDWRHYLNLSERWDSNTKYIAQTIGINLIDLVRLPCMNSMIARQLHRKGYVDISSLIHLKPKEIELALVTSKDLIPDGNDDPNEARIYLSTIDQTITISELSKMIIKEARWLTENEIGQKISFNDELESGSTVNSPASIVDQQEQENREESAASPMERSNASIDSMKSDSNKRMKIDSSLPSQDYVEVPIEG
ncbi:DNA polymerase theta-like protein [Euroglyphus maynei]|uniref:DNA polymerase theta-like protein n=1 Tax=Euroglyphus maynei TaxID=6958 RepID=A0A1Y3B182_EURMA|nr:DNA polymerase theta-like protein [Euroglyphus maynei]